MKHAIYSCYLSAQTYRDGDKGDQQKVELSFIFYYNHLFALCDSPAFLPSMNHPNSLFHSVSLTGQLLLSTKSHKKFYVPESQGQARIKVISRGTQPHFNQEKQLRT